MKTFETPTDYPEGGYPDHVYAKCHICADLMENLPSEMANEDAQGLASGLVFEGAGILWCDEGHLVLYQPSKLFSFKIHIVAEEIEYPEES